MKDFCIEQDETNVNLALIGEVLGAAGVNIEGLCLITCEGRSVIHFVVEDAEIAKRLSLARMKRVLPVSRDPLDEFAACLRIMASKSTSPIQPRITDLFWELITSRRHVS
jgi:hypothetical protein